MKIRTLFSKAKTEAEMSEEMRQHVERQTELHIAAGMNPDEARHQALRKFGNVASIQEQARVQQSGIWLENLWRDLGFAVRSLRRAPVFSLAVISTFALCLGPNAAIFNTLYVLVLKPQPFHEPDRIVRIYNTFAKVGGALSKQDSSMLQYLDFKAHADLFTDFAVMRYVPVTIGEETVPEKVRGMRVNAGFFDFFGVKPVIGRFGTTEEESVGRDHVLVLAERYWESRYNSDPDIIGRVIRVNSEPWTVIGVAPRSLEVLDIHTQFFKPYESLDDDKGIQTRYAFRLVLFGRLKPEINRDAALSQLATIDHRFVEEIATPFQRSYLKNGGHRIALGAIDEQTSALAKTPLTLMQLGAAFVLLIGVVNIANLMLARANVRRSELAIRQALGAGRGTLLRQLLVESLLLTATATVVGIGLAWSSLQGINLYLGKMSWTASPVEMDAHVLGAMGSLAVVLGAVLGTISSGAVWRSGSQIGASRTTSADTFMRRVSSALVVVQMAVALALLVEAGLLIKSFAQVMAIHPGFDAGHIVQGRLAMSRAYEDADKNVALQQRMLDAMREIPGVDQASLVMDTVLSPVYRSFPFLLRSTPVSAGENKPQANFAMVSPDFLPTMNVRLLERRFFTDADDRRNGPIVIVDDLFVRRYFPDRNPIGQEVNFGQNPQPDAKAWSRIVGVVKRPQMTGLEERDGLPFIFAPMIQRPNAGFNLVLHSMRPAADVLAAMRLKIREIDPTLPLYDAASLQDGLDDMVRSRRGIMSLLAIFAGLAALLAGVGLYGVLAYDVSQRTREIGIRGAIGATRAQIVGMVVRQGMGKTVIGLAAGCGGAMYLTRFIQTQLFDVRAFDPETFVGVSFLMIAVALFACWIPARRAAQVDPVVALRAE